MENEKWKMIRSLPLGVLRAQSSERKKVKNPSQRQTNYHEFSKYFKSIKESIFVCVFRHGPENNRSEDRECGHDKKVSQDFLPAEISKASSIAR